MLEKIQRALEEFGLPVFYGLVPDGEELESWDYYVFNRAEMEKAGNVNYVSTHTPHAGRDFTAISQAGHGWSFYSHAPCGT